MVKKRVFVCDDHTIIIDGLRLLFKNHPDFELVGFAQQGEELLDGLRRRKPHILLLDLNLKETDGFSLLEKIRERDTGLRVLILTMYQDEALIDRARILGANGFLPKNISNDDLVAALHSVESGGFHLPAATHIKLKQKSVLRDQFVEKMKLTRRELEVIRYIVKGQSSQQMAKQLNVSENTVETHRKNIFRKVKLSNVAELVTFAHENHLI